MRLNWKNKFPSFCVLLYSIVWKDFVVLRMKIWKNQDISRKFEDRLKRDIVQVFVLYQMIISYLMIVPWVSTLLLVLLVIWGKDSEKTMSTEYCLLKSSRKEYILAYNFLIGSWMFTKNLIFQIILNEMVFF